MAIGNVLPGGALGQLDSRQSGVRRELYEPKWSTLRIPRSNERDLVFFAIRAQIDRVSNIDQAGVISVHEGLLVFRMLFIPWFGTSLMDYAAIARETIIELTIQKDKAYSLILGHQLPGVGFNFDLPSLGEPAPSKATDLGEVDIGPGETFEGRLRFFRALQTGNDVLATLQLESMTDEPIA